MQVIIRTIELTLALRMSSLACALRELMLRALPETDFRARAAVLTA